MVTRKKPGSWETTTRAFYQSLRVSGFTKLLSLSNVLVVVTSQYFLLFSWQFIDQLTFF